MDDTSRAGLDLEGRYELIELLSEGGMGAVWRGRHRTLDRPVAIKLMRAALRDDPAMRERFSSEARVASGLNHPNIVSVTDFGVDAARGYFLVMELLQGETLAERLDEHRMRARVVCDVVEQLAWALRYIHARGIIHCDLKPENIFLARLDDESRRRNHVKLIDFGLALRTTSDPTVLAGTPAYLAPERLKGAPPSASADIYSLGALFYEMLTGRRPVDGTLMQIVDQHARGELPPPPSTLVTDEVLEPRTDDVVLRALSPDPAQRQPSTEAFLFELRTLMSMMGMRVRRVARSGRNTLVRRGRATAATRPTTPRRVRVFERVPVSVPATLRRPDQAAQAGVAANLSEGGLFIRVAAPPPPGVRVEISLRVPGEPRPIGATAVVRWQQIGCGCGLEWVEPTEQLRRSVLRVLAHAG